MTSIGDYAFESCSGLTSVTIPNNVTSIGDYAFYGCSGLTSVTIPNNVTSIGDNAFVGCTSLTAITVDDGNVSYSSADGVLFNKAKTKLIVCPIKKTGSYVIPNTVTSIGDYAFDSCSDLTSITIGSGVTTIGAEAFYMCSGLTSVTIPNSVTTIGDEAFEYCSNLASVYVMATTPPALDGEAANTFYGNAGGRKIYVPNKTTYTDAAGWSSYSSFIEDLPVTASGSCGTNCTYILYGNGQLVISGTGELTDGQPWSTYKSSITSVIIGDGVTSIGNGAFYGCTSLTSIDIPNSVTSIGMSAFAGCSGLTSFTIPNNVTSIGNNAFSDCSNLTSITIGSGVTSIGTLAFMGSPIATVTFANGLTSIGDSWFKQYYSLTTVNIPNSVTSIGNQAFYSTGLTSVDIPSSVTSIGENAFFGCNNLATVTCWATTAPTIGSNAFTSSIKIYVPSVEEYTSKTSWNIYSSHLFPISEKSPAATMPQTTRSITTGVYEGSWTTFYYSGAHMQAPEGVTVYKATVSGNELMLDEISDGIITAGKAVILKKATEGDIVLSVVASGSSDDYEGNALRGVDTETAQSGTNYVLSMVGGNFGFYKLASSKKLSANKAYLPGSSISGAREFVGFGFSEGATKIDHVSVKTNEVDGTVYDLQGRRVSQPTKGLYIVNGKKVVIK